MRYSALMSDEIDWKKGGGVTKPDFTIPEYPDTLPVPAPAPTPREPEQRELLFGIRDVARNLRPAASFTALAPAPRPDWENQTQQEGPATATFPWR